MMVALLLSIGLVVEVALGIYVVLLARMERIKLRKLVEQAGTDFVTAVDDLPQPYRAVARPLADQLAMEQDFDDALLDAVVETAQQPFKKPLWLRLVVAVICSIALLAPASYGLLLTAREIVRSWDRAQALDTAVVYLRGQTELDLPFEQLRTAFHGSALLFFGLAFVWALAWYLRRPEVREARFVRALLEAAARVSPKSTAPVSGRLAELIAPDRGLGRPITALVVCLAGITAGWFVLYETADVRAANVRDPIYDVWPAKRARLLSPPSDVNLPQARAGTPLGSQPPPSLTIAQNKASVGSEPIVIFVDGAFPEKWENEVSEELGRSLIPGLGRVVVLAHRQMPLSLVLQLFRYLQETHDIDQFDLIVERTVKTGVPGGRPLQAAILLEYASERPAALTIRFEGSGILVPPDPAQFAYEGNELETRLQELVRQKPELLRKQHRMPIALDIQSREISYGRFVEVLAAADTACMRTEDCGLPGLGIEFIIPKAPSP